jgi:hypothetical protein
MYRLSTGNIGATAGQDYIGIADKDIIIPTSATEISETIPILENGILENDETFSVTITSRSAPHLVTANPVVTVVTITDNDGKDFSRALAGPQLAYCFG